MQIRLFIYKLESLMKEKYPQIKIDFYCSCRKKNIHIGLDRALFSFSEYSSIIKDFEQFFLKNKMDHEFEFVKPLLNHSVKWSYDYIIFRKRLMILFKRYWPAARTPLKAYPAGNDLYANETKLLPARGRVRVSVDLKLAVPKGFFG